MKEFEDNISGGGIHQWNDSYTGEPYEVPEFYHFKCAKIQEVGDGKT